MIQTILLARVRKSGEQVVLLGSEVDFSKQKAELHKFDSAVHKEYDTVGLYQLVPQKKVLKLMTPEEHKSHTKPHSQNEKHVERSEQKPTRLRIISMRLGEIIPHLNSKNRPNKMF